LQFSGEESETQSIQIENQTDQIQRVISDIITGPFQTINECGILRPGDSCTIDVQYTPIPPELGAPDHGRITLLTTDDGNVHQIELTVVKNLSDISISANTMQFSGQQVGSDSTPQTVTITNTGTKDATVTTTVAGDFVMTKGCSGTIPAGHSCAVTVMFTPSSAGNRNGTLLIAGSNTLHPISLVGTGVKVPSRQKHGLNPGISIAGGGLAVGLPLGLPLMLNHGKKDAEMSSLTITPAQLSLECEGRGCLARGNVTIAEGGSERFGLIFMTAGPVHETGCEMVKHDGRCILSVAIRPSVGDESHGFIAISDSQGRPLKLIAVSGSLRHSPNSLANVCGKGPQCAAGGDKPILISLRDLPACAGSNHLSFRKSWLGRQDRTSNP
jgi:hypothetical protein